MELTSKKLYALSCDVFERKKAALPRYKRLCERTIRVTMDGQSLAPRQSKHHYHYRLFADLLEILQQEHDRLLEIEEAMGSLLDLQEFLRAAHRTQQTFTTAELGQNGSSFKPVKNRPPTPAKLLNLREIMARVPSPYYPPSCSNSVTPPAMSPSGYSSSNSNESDSTTTTTTTTVKTSWSQPTNHHSSSSSDDNSGLYY